MRGCPRFKREVVGGDMAEAPDRVAEVEKKQSLRV